VTVVDLATRRRERIGGSEAAAACGVDPHRSRIMLWAEKTGRVRGEATEPMMWGSILEPVVFRYLEATDWEVMPAPADEGVHPDYPWLVGHVDGYVNIGGERGVLEIKTGSSWTVKDWRDNIGAPIAYVIQCQHYLELTGLDVALLACLVGGQRLETRIVHRDAKLIERMLHLEYYFKEMVRLDVPPPPDGSDSAGDAIKALYPEGVDRSVRLTGETWEAFKELRQRREQLAAVKEQVAELQQRIELAMGDAVEAYSPFDTRVATWRNVQRSQLDTKALRADHPALADEYTVKQTTRRFTVE
jgi:putative phage-type endonuclease